MIDQEMNVMLIDLGFTTKFMESPNKHKLQASQESFGGNIIFASHNQMSFKNTSRKDDMVSLTYLVLTMLNHNHFPCFDNEWTAFYDNDDEMRAKFLELQSHKERFSLSKMS